MSCSDADRLVRQRAGALLARCCAAAAALQGARSRGSIPPSSSPRRLLVAGCVLAFGVTAGRAASPSFFCAVLVVISAIDLEHRIVPNRIVLPAFGDRARRADPARIRARSGRSARSAPPASSSLAALAYPAGMGMGDVKLALLLGAMLGRTVVRSALMLGMLPALVPSVVLLARHGAEARKMGDPVRRRSSPSARVSPSSAGDAAPGRVSEPPLSRRSALEHVRQVVPITRSRD